MYTTVCNSMGVRLQKPEKQVSPDSVFSRIPNVRKWAIPSVKSSKFRTLNVAISGKMRPMHREDPFLDTF